MKVCASLSRVVALSIGAFRKNFLEHNSEHATWSFHHHLRMVKLVRKASAMPVNMPSCHLFRSHTHFIPVMEAVTQKGVINFPCPSLSDQLITAWNLSFSSVCPYLKISCSFFLSTFTFMSYGGEKGETWYQTSSINSFLQHCDKISNSNNLREEMLALSFNFKGISTHLGRETWILFMVVGTRQSSHLAATPYSRAYDHKQRQP